MGTVCFQTTGLLPERFSAAHLTAACFYCSRMRQPLLWAGHKCQDTFMLKLNAQLIFKSKPCVWESFAPSDAKNGIFRSKACFILGYFFITKWWPMQREEMTSQLDLHFTPIFERRVSVLCQFLHPFRPQAQRPQWIRNSTELTSAAFKSGTRHIHT